MSADEKKRWQKSTLSKSLERQGRRKEPFTRSGGEPVDDVYVAADLSDALQM